MKAASLSLILFLIPSQLAAQGVLELLTPEDGAMDVSVNPTFVWNHPSQGSVFTLEVSTNSEFSSPEVDLGNLDSDSIQIEGLQHSTVYYWRVRIGNGVGGGAFSQVRSFTTVAATPRQLLAPLLVSPENEATDVPTSLSFVWNFSLNAASYKLQVSTDLDFDSLVFDQGGLADSVEQVLGLENGVLYYWRVSALDTGEVEVYSSIRSFTTVASNPGPLTLMLPEDGATDVSVNPTFVWSHSSQGPVFTLEISTDPEFSSSVISIDKISGTSKQVEGLEYDELYYWRVKIGQGHGSLSTVRSFKTAAAIPGQLLAPLLVLPEDGATDVPVSFSLVWSLSPGAVAYRLQVSTDSDFSSLVFDQNALTDSSQVISGLENNTQYYWRVSAVDTGEAEVYSYARSFTTVAVNPAAPALVSPENGATDVPTSPTLVWNNASQGPVFTLEISTNPEFASLVTSVDHISGDSMQVEGLEYNTLYYWRVRKAQGQALISNVWSFTTIAAPTSVERLNNGIPETFALRQNFPNPFNPQTTVQFSVAKESRVTLAIFNMLGATVEVLADQTFAPGNYQIQWTPQNLPSGMYFYRLHTADFTRTRKLLLLR